MDTDKRMPGVLGYPKGTAHASVPEEEGQSTADRGAQGLQSPLDRGPSDRAGGDDGRRRREDLRRRREDR